MRPADGYRAGKTFYPGQMSARIALCIVLLSIGGHALAAGKCDTLSVLGKWQGTAMQPGYGVYPMELEITGLAGSRAGKVEYPTLGCGGSLAYVKESASCVHQFRETIEHGGRKCVNGGIVNVSAVNSVGARHLQWTWSYPDGRVGATADLQAKSEPRISGKNSSTSSKGFAQNLAMGTGSLNTATHNSTPSADTSSTAVRSQQMPKSYSKGDFVVDNFTAVQRSDGSYLVNADIFNVGAASGALEIRNANGTLIGIPDYISGHRPLPEDLYDFFIGNFVNIGKSVTDKYSPLDKRDTLQSKKTVIRELIVPAGAAVKLTKTSQSAVTYNLLELMVDLFGIIDSSGANRGTIHMKLYKSIEKELVHNSFDIVKRAVLGEKLDRNWLMKKFVDLARVILSPENLDGRTALGKALKNHLMGVTPYIQLIEIAGLEGKFFNDAATTLNLRNAFRIDSSLTLGEYPVSTNAHIYGDEDSTMKSNQVSSRAQERKAYWDRWSDKKKGNIHNSRLSVKTASQNSARTSAATIGESRQGLVVKTYPASGIYYRGATLNGYASYPGKNVRVWFEWGETPSLGQATRAKAFYSEWSAHDLVLVPAPDKTYYYRLVAESSGSLLRGETLSFFPSSAVK